MNSIYANIIRRMRRLTGPADVYACRQRLVQLSMEALQSISVAPLLTNCLLWVWTSVAFIGSARLPAIIKNIIYKLCAMNTIDPMLIWPEIVVDIRQNIYLCGRRGVVNPSRNVSAAVKVSPTSSEQRGPIMHLFQLATSYPSHQFAKRLKRMCKLAR